MKKIFILIFCVIILSGCVKQSESEILPNTPFSEFILGRWTASRKSSDIYGSYTERFIIVFTSKDELKYCHIIPHNSLCDQYSYILIDGDIYEVDSERLINNQWKMNRQGENLYICFIKSDKDNCISLTRDNSIINKTLEIFGIYR